MNRNDAQCEVHDLIFNAENQLWVYFSNDVNKRCRMPLICMRNYVCQFNKEHKYPHINRK